MLHDMEGGGLVGAPNHGKFWTAEEAGFVEQNVGKLTHRQMAEVLGRTVTAVQEFARIERFIYAPTNCTQCGKELPASLNPGRPRMVCGKKCARQISKVFLLKEGIQIFECKFSKIGRAHV